jgi:hypothetical protein
LKSLGSDHWISALFVDNESWRLLPPRATAVAAFLEAFEKIAQPGFVEFDIFAAINLVSANLELASQFLSLSIASGQKLDRLQKNLVFRMIPTCRHFIPKKLLDFGG